MVQWVSIPGPANGSLLLDRYVSMRTNCLAIGMRKESLQQLLGVFQHFNDSFGLSSVDPDEDIHRYMASTRFSLLFMDASFEASIASQEIKSYLSKNRSRIPLLVIDEKKKKRVGTVDSLSSKGRIIAAPYSQVSLASAILTALSTFFCQGKMTGISIALTLQLIEMDKLTCTLAITNKKSTETGWIFFKDGLPLNAGLGIFEGALAIQQMGAMRDVGLTIYNSCPLRENRLHITCSKIVFSQRKAPLGSMGKKKTTQKPSPHRKEKTGLATLYVNVNKNRQEHTASKGK